MSERLSKALLILSIFDRSILWRRKGFGCNKCCVRRRRPNTFLRLCLQTVFGVPTGHCFLSGGRESIRIKGCFHTISSGSSPTTWYLAYLLGTSKALGYNCCADSRSFNIVRSITLFSSNHKFEKRPNAEFCLLTRVLSLLYCKRPLYPDNRRIDPPQAQPINQILFNIHQ